MFKLILVATLVALSCASKRDTESTVTDEQCHGSWNNDIHCCNGDTFEKTEFEKFDEALHECAKEIWGPDEEPSYDPFNCEQVSEIKEKSVCIMECMLKKIDALDDKGFIKRDSVIEHFKTSFKDTEWKTKATEGIIDKCIGSVDKTLVDEKKCNPASMQFMHCAWKEYIKECPKELQNDGWKCKKIREKIEKGDANYLKRVYFHKFILQNHHHDHHHEHESTEKKE